MSLARHFSALALVAGLLVPAAACAQQNPPPSQAQQQQPQAAPGAAAPHHRAGLRQALKRLNLTPDQRQQIAGIMKQTRQANQNADQPTRRANMKQMRAQINGVLTADQQTQLRRTLRAMHRGAGATAPAAAPNPG
jgi:Spy/CpxP family protein refolding chaperone